MLESVSSKQIHYRPGETAVFIASVKNTGTTAVTVTVCCEVVYDLQQVLGRQQQPVTVKAGAAQQVTFQMPLGNTEYGHEVRVWLDGQAGAVKRAWFGVSKNVGKVGMLGRGAYTNYTDEFAWAPDDFGNLSPAQDTWWSGQVNRQWTKTQLQQRLAEFHARGLKCLTYGKGVAGGPDGIRLLLEHPDWAVYNRYGQLGGLDMSFDVWSLKHWADTTHRTAAGHDWHFWNCWTPNFLHEETVRYGADAIVRGARMFGWDGVRFDAQFDIFGGYDLTGKPLPAGAARDAINARNVRLMKNQVRRQYPDFTFGYNYGFPMPQPTSLDQAVCADLGLVMDEGIRNASDPQHPLQDWRHYARHIREESSAVRRLGGVPLIFSSFVQGAAADYALALCLAGGGTPYGWDFANNRHAYDAFATRYSGLLWSAAYPCVRQPETHVDVRTGGRQLWWQDWVRAGNGPDGTPRCIIHLINPPDGQFIRDTRLPAPSEQVQVLLRTPQRGAVRSWLLTCDSEPHQTPLDVTATADGYTVTIDHVEQWAVVVFAGSPLQALATAASGPEQHEAQLTNDDTAPPLPPLDLAPAANVSADFTGATARRLDNGRIRLENRWLRLEIDPPHGGRIASFVDKRDGLERILPGRLEGMCFDNMYDQDAMLYQGQWEISQAAPYTAEILEAGNAKARVRVNREAITEEGGILNENYAGLQIEREFRLSADAPTVECVIRLHNRSAEGRNPAYALRNGYVDGVHREQLRYFRPSRHGIHLAGPNLPATDQMVWDPAAGWTATLDLDSRRGIAWLLDPGKVMMFYNCINAISGRHIEEFPNRYGVDPLYMFDNASVTAIGADWYYRRACIPAGGVWETQVTLVPFQGLTSVAHACDDFVASVTWPANGAEQPVELTVQRAARALTHLRVTAVIEGKSFDMQPANAGTDALLTCRLVLPPSLRKAALAQFTVAGESAEGKPVSITFPYVVTPVSPDASPVLPAPKPVLDYQPRLSTRPAHAQPNVLFVQGLGFERWELLEALARHGATVHTSEFMKRRIATCIRYFPATLDEALQYDVIILGAVDAFALSQEGVLLLQDYVRNGGSLLVLGGLYSWGGGRFQEFGLDGLLPLHVARTFDLTPAGGKPVVWDSKAYRETFGQPAPAALTGVQWLHALTPAPDARVLARCGKQSVIAVRQYGAGRVVAYALTTLGKEDAAKPSCWKSPAWQAHLEAMISWLLHR